jgi:hypothetical protein
MAVAAVGTALNFQEKRHDSEITAGIPFNQTFPPSGGHHIALRLDFSNILHMTHSEL